MTNEEILKKSSGHSAGHPAYFYKEILSAMDAARKDEAIAFAEWLRDESWKMDYGEQVSYTTEQFYQLFKSQNNG